METASYFSGRHYKLVKLYLEFPHAIGKDPAHPIFLGLYGLKTLLFGTSMMEKIFLSQWITAKYT
ncbi:MAG: hypothetical protein LBE38_08075 [Deltaproteobacteria bacterium]|nr:hypothetical protein [Deltaproteobacteria bacterium]